MKNLLEFLLLHLVDNPDEISIEEIETERAIEFRISVHPDDVSKVIGKKGRIIKAIRKLSQVKAVKDQIKVMVTVVE